MKIEIPLNEVRTLSDSEPKGLFLLDLSWLLYQGWYAFKGLETENGIKAGHFYYVSKTVCSLLKAYPDWAVILCQDQYPTEKYALYPDYKGQRGKRPFNLREESTKIISLLTYLPGVYAAKSINQEADAVMASIVHESRKRCVIYSGDDDLLQCLGPNCVITRKIDNGKIIPIRNDYAIKKYGVKPRQLLIFRTLTGDQSDNIKGYLRFPKRIAKFLAERYSHPEQIINSKIQNKKDKTLCKYMQMIKDDPHILRRNFKLMKLKPVPLILFKDSIEDFRSEVKKYGLSEVFPHEGTHFP